MQNDWESRSDEAMQDKWETSSAEVMQNDWESRSDEAMQDNWETSSAEVMQNDWESRSDKANSSHIRAKYGLSALTLSLSLCHLFNSLPFFSFDIFSIKVRVLFPPEIAILNELILI